MFGGEAHVGVGVQDLDRWQQGSQAGCETLPAHAMELAATSKRLYPALQHIAAKRSHPLEIARNGVMWQMSSKCLSSVPEGSNFLRDLLVAIVAVATAVGLRLLLMPVLYDRAAFLLFGLAVMISSWRGGRRVGLITTTLATLVGVLVFVR